MYRDIACLALRVKIDHQFFAAVADKVASQDTFALVEHEVEEVIKVAEERAEGAAARGFLGGPQMWGLIALAVVIVILLIFYIR